MSEKKRSFVFGAAILAGAGLIGKVIGAFYKIWLAALIGQGMVFYNLPYPLYSFLLVVSSAGLPTAISRMVSARLATGDRQGARRVFVSARKVLFFTGLVASVLMLVLAKPLEIAFHREGSAPAFMALAPAIFFVCLISAYRGYFQGMQRMAPTAASQIVEQIGKIAIGFPLATYFMPQGPIWAAVGAISGIALSELAALILMLGASARQNVKDRDIRSGNEKESGILSKLFAIAIPISIGSAMMPIVGLIDSSLVFRRLADIGLTVAQADTMFDTLTTIVNSMVNMPAVITLSLSMALVPAISSAMAVKNHHGVEQTAKTGIKLAVLIGLPAAIGMGLLAEPIVRTLFSSRRTQESILLGAQLLSMMSVGVFFLSIIQTTTGIFQGLGKPIVPVYTMGVGILLKIALNYLLIGNSAIHIFGAVIATISCYLVAAIGNLYFIAKYAKIKPGFFLFFWRPLVAAGGMAAGILLLKQLVGTSLSGAKFLVVAIAVGALLYFALAFLTGCIAKEDLAMLPGGKHLSKYIRK